MHRSARRETVAPTRCKIDDEAFRLEVLSAGGDVVDTFAGTADEHATAVGTLTEDGQELHHSNDSFVATATNAAGSMLRLQRERPVANRPPDGRHAQVRLRHPLLSRPVS